MFLHRNSEDFRPALSDAFPPSDQEARPSAAYSELIDVLAHTSENLSIDWPHESRESQSSKHDERFLSGLIQRLQFTNRSFG